VQIIQDSCQKTPGFLAEEMRNSNPLVQVMLSASASVAVKQAVAERLEKPSRPATAQKTAGDDSRPMGVVGTQAPSSRRTSKDRTYSELSGRNRYSDADSLDGTGGGVCKPGPGISGGGRKAPRTPEIQERVRGGADLDVGLSSSPDSHRKEEAPPGGRGMSVGSPCVMTPSSKQGSKQGRPETGQIGHGSEVAFSIGAEHNPIGERLSRSPLDVSSSQDLGPWDDGELGRSALDPDWHAGGHHRQAELLPKDLNDNFSFSLPATPSHSMALDPEAGRGADDGFSSLLYHLPVTSSAAIKRSEGKLLLLKERQKRGVAVRQPPQLCFGSLLRFVRCSETALRRHCMDASD